MLIFLHLEHPLEPNGTLALGQVCEGVFDMPALEGLANEPGSGQPELGPERPVALFDVFVWLEPGSSLLLV
jgi:hypothetical protein